jgi:hypothetical protein
MLLRHACCFTAALLLLYCCFTAALLLLYCCFTTAPNLPLMQVKMLPHLACPAYTPAALLLYYYSA